MSFIDPLNFRSFKNPSENSERQLNFGLKPALSPALSPPPTLRFGAASPAGCVEAQRRRTRRGRNGFRCSHEPRVRMAENSAKVKSNCHSNTFHNFQIGSKIMNLERLDQKSALFPDGVVSLVFPSNLSP
jgi:hypothetical protein